jgi:enoyl-CoA hydratase
MNFDAYSGLLFERRDNGVLLITINRPEKYNACDEALHQALVTIWPEISKDPETRVVVITGAGKAFSAGGDVEREVGVLGDYAQVTDMMNDARDLVLNIVNCEKPVISAINGVAVGAGLAVALMADISIIGSEVRFTDGHLRMGVAAGDHATIIWPLLCGLAKAKYYLLTADFITGEEAERIGLVSKCVPAERVLEEALTIADKLAVGPQLPLIWTKRALNHWIRNAQPIFEASLALEMLNFFGSDAREGFEAFNEKRPAVFTGESAKGAEK